MAATAHGDNWELRVGNQKGYLLRVEAAIECGLDACAFFSLSTHPGLRALMASREVHQDCKVLQMDSHYKEMTLVQLTGGDGVLRKKQDRSLLHIIEDRRNPQSMLVSCKALQSTSFKKYSGDTRFSPVLDPASGNTVGSKAEMTQDVLPKGMPQWLTRMPLLGRVLRDACLKHVQRLLAELQAAIDQVLAHAAREGVSHAAAVDAVCDPTGQWAAERAEQLRQAQQAQQCGGDGGGGLRSFAFNDAGSDLGEEEEEEEEEEEGEGEVEGEAAEGNRDEAGGDKGGTEEGADKDDGEGVAAVVEALGVCCVASSGAEEGGSAGSQPSDAAAARMASSGDGDDVAGADPRRHTEAPSSKVPGVRRRASVARKDVA